LLSLGYYDRAVDEPALIDAAQRGELDAFNRLVLQYQELAFSVAMRVMGEEAAAADATQEAFISAYRSLAGYRGGSFRSWLLRIVTNSCYDELRRRKRRPAVSLEALVEDSEIEGSVGTSDPAENPEVAAQRHELIDAIQDCLTGLPPEFRIVAVLVDVQGLDYEEAAQSIGKPLGTVKSRLARARAKLRDCLKAYGELLPAEFRLQNEAVP
jgi:RNA polymerase sigma-70 factor (ECF subfamily)